MEVSVNNGSQVILVLYIAQPEEYGRHPDWRHREGNGAAPDHPPKIRGTSPDIFPRDFTSLEEKEKTTHEAEKFGLQRVGRD